MKEKILSALMGVSLMATPVATVSTQAASRSQNVCVTYAKNYRNNTVANWQAKNGRTSKITWYRVKSKNGGRINSTFNQMIVNALNSYSSSRTRQAVNAKIGAATKNQDVVEVSRGSAFTGYVINIHHYQGNRQGKTTRINNKGKISTQK